MTTFRERLRALPVLPEGLPAWEVEDLDDLPRHRTGCSSSGSTRPSPPGRRPRTR
ncbi:hypothetical protein UQW22_12420 [Isoptericola halotolerans]|uniref:hypothetical protein n=1 Tax=Isoptericola halotolerans TaxID=300560 RepID=UPI00389091C3